MHRSAAFRPMPMRYRRQKTHVGAKFKKMTAYHSHNMTLYCDNRKNSKRISRLERVQAKPGEHFDSEFPMEFLAIDGKTCIQQAKEIGWYFHRDGRTVCPRCHLGGIKLKPGDEIPLTLGIPQNNGEIKSE